MGMRELKYERMIKIIGRKKRKGSRKRGRPRESKKRKAGTPAELPTTADLPEPGLVSPWFQGAPPVHSECLSMCPNGGEEGAWSVSRASLVFLHIRSSSSLHLLFVFLLSLCSHEHSHALARASQCKSSCTSALPESEPSFQNTASFVVSFSPGCRLTGGVRTSIVSRNVMHAFSF